MSIGAPSNPLRPEAAAEWFSERMPFPREVWEQLERRAQRQGFTVAGVANLDVLNQVWAAIDDAIRNGTNFEDFRSAITDQLERAWGGANPSRVETIFRTNIQTAYNAGRWAEARHPDVHAHRPFWMFSAILDSRTTEICAPLDGIIRRADDPWWLSHLPPLHFNCRSTFVTLDPIDARMDDTGVTGLGAEPTQHGFGETPTFSEWHPQAHDYPPPLWQAFQQWLSQ